MARLMVETVRLEPVVGIHQPHELAAFAEKHNLRHDWHEPDESGISARIYGEDLDNAMGSGWVPDKQPISDGYAGELNVVLMKDGKDIAVVNLATLLAWAAQTGRGAAIG